MVICSVMRELFCHASNFAFPHYYPYAARFLVTVKSGVNEIVIFEFSIEILNKLELTNGLILNIYLADMPCYK